MSPENLKPEEEEDVYHFSDEPDTSSFEVPAPSTQPQPTTEQPAAETEPKKTFSVPDFSKIMTKYPIFEKIKPVLEAIQQKFILRVALIAVLVILILAVFYSCSSNPLAQKTKEKITYAPVIHLPSNKTHEIIVSRVPPVSIGKKTVVPTPSMDVDMPRDRLSRLEKENTELQAQLSAMSAQMLTLNSNVGTTAANLKQISDQLAQLATAVQNEEKVNAGLIEKLERQEKMMLNAGKIGSSEQPVQYFLQAIIPGRAWLISSEGETLTVSRGTPLGSYGRVSFIDAASGRVLTSSGNTIIFKPDES
ncbi:MAG: hypothetical protein ACO1N3_00815 [Gammaproteobacteria bacterium]